MSRATLNYLIDAATLLVLLGMVATGLILEFVLPPGSGGIRHAPDTLWTLARHDWGDVHFYAAITMAGFVALHLALHWNWAFTTTARLLTRGKSSASMEAWRRNAVGFGLLTAVLASFVLFVIVARTYVASPDGQEDEQAQAEYAEQADG